MPASLPRERVQAILEDTRTLIQKSQDLSRESEARLREADNSTATMNDIRRAERAGRL